MMTANGGCRISRRASRRSCLAPWPGRPSLDLCAAPGGKTAQLAFAGAAVTAVDLAADRIARLQSNLARLKLTADCVVADVLDYEPGRLFDAVLLDAPCTATGTIRRHPDIPFLKRPSDVPAMAELQGKLLERAVRLVRPGGILVYATCSLEPEEGEGIVKAALERLPVTLSPIRAGGTSGPLRCPRPSRRVPAHPAVLHPGRNGRRHRRILCRALHSDLIGAYARLYR